MFISYIYKDSLFYQFKFRGYFSRLSNNAGKNLKIIRAKERQDKSWISLFNCHIDKPIKVTLGFFDSELVMSFKQETFLATLISIDKDSEYCKVQFPEANHFNTIHKSSIKLL